MSQIKFNTLSPPTPEKYAYKFNNDQLHIILNIKALHKLFQNEKLALNDFIELSKSLYLKDNELTKIFNDKVHLFNNEESQKEYLLQKIALLEESYFSLQNMIDIDINLVIPEISSLLIRYDEGKNFDCLFNLLVNFNNELVKADFRGSKKPIINCIVNIMTIYNKNNKNDTIYEQLEFILINVFDWLSTSYRLTLKTIINRLFALKNNIKLLLDKFGDHINEDILKSKYLEDNLSDEDKEAIELYARKRNIDLSLNQDSI